jgi:hypothetical protein
VHREREGYRTAPPLPDRVLSVGTIAATQDEFEARARSANVTALVIVALSGATLLAAAAHGIVL